MTQQSISRRCFTKNTEAHVGRSIYKEAHFRIAYNNKILETAYTSIVNKLSYTFLCNNMKALKRTKYFHLRKLEKEEFKLNLSRRKEIQIKAEINELDKSKSIEKMKPKLFL